MIRKWVIRVHVLFGHSRVAGFSQVFCQRLIVGSIAIIRLEDQNRSLL
jgi:hypothetical protein